MKELPPFSLDKTFYGDFEKFCEFLADENSAVVFDIDGILENTPEVVLAEFTKKHFILTNQSKIDNWNYLMELAKENLLPKNLINEANDLWYKADILSRSKPYLYMDLAVQAVIDHQGKDNTFVLTAREPHLVESTMSTLNKDYPNIKQQNILIRKDTAVSTTDFKVNEIAKLAKSYKRVVFIEDTIHYVKPVLDAEISNVLVVNIPLGLMWPDFSHERMIVLKRDPEFNQGMLPLLQAINVAQSY